MVEWLVLYSSTLCRSSAIELIRSMNWAKMRSFIPSTRLVYFMLNGGRYSEIVKYIMYKYCLGSLWLVFRSFSLALFLLHTDIRKFSMLALEFKGLMQCVGYVKCTFFSFNCTKYSIVWNCHLVRHFIRIASSRFVDSRDLEAAIRHLRQLY